MSEQHNGSISLHVANDISAITAATAASLTFHIC